MSIILSAFAFAFKKHSGRVRKGTKIPYIAHPIDVASILMKEKGRAKVSDALVAAGLLHDVLEDTDATYDELTKVFGKKIADLVKAVSEPEEFKGISREEKIRTWRPRKTHTIESIKVADRNVKMLSCADKLANIRDIINEHDVKGEKIWAKFNAPRENIEWYYRNMVKSYAGENGIERTRLFKALENHITDLFGVDRTVVVEEKLEPIYCGKCRRKYPQSQCTITGIMDEDGFMDGWGIICPKKHQFEVDKEDI